MCTPRSAHALFSPLPAKPGPACVITSSRRADRLRRDSGELALFVLQDVRGAGRRCIRPRRRRGVRDALRRSRPHRPRPRPVPTAMRVRRRRLHAPGVRRGLHPVARRPDWQPPPRLSLPSRPTRRAGAPAADPPGMVCGVLEQRHWTTAAIPRLYALVTYDSAAAAAAAGAKVTNFGRCGVCSTLANLAVYMAATGYSSPRFARAVSRCSPGWRTSAPTSRASSSFGFDLPCAQAWASTRAHHPGHLPAPLHRRPLRRRTTSPTAPLDPCLRCDEEQSGPTFKAVAGRDRRNSGIPNAICRPCGEVEPLVQSY